MIKLFFLFFLFPFQVFATILFVDTNFSPLEVSEARKAAAERGEDFIVVPDSYTLSKADRDIIATAKKQDANVHERMKLKHTGEQFMGFLEELKEISARLLPYKLSSEALKIAIAKAPGDISTIIISGHSEGASFSGVLVNTSRPEIVKFMEEANRLKKLRSIYLWGCYSGTAGASLTWQQAAPELELILGFETKGPTGETISSGKMLSKVLKLEANMIKESESKKILESIKDFNKLDTQHLMGAMTNSCYISVKSDKVIPSNQITMGCIDITNELNSEKHILYEPYQKGEKSLKDLEKSENDVRKFYNRVQENLQCLWTCAPREKQDEMLKIYPDKISQSIAAQIPCPGQLISLIKFPHVFNNYKRAYGAELEDLKKVLAQDTKMSQHCKNIFLLNYSQDSSRNIYKDYKYNCPKEASDPAIIPKLEIIIERLRESMIDMSAIPLSWIEEQAEPESLKSGKEMYEIDPEYLPPQSFAEFLK